jgi:hypothetical protein
MRLPLPKIALLIWSTIGRPISELVPVGHLQHTIQCYDLVYCIRWHAPEMPFTFVLSTLGLLPATSRRQAALIGATCDGVSSDPVEKLASKQDRTPCPCQYRGV